MRHGLLRCGFALLMLSATVVSGCGGGSSPPRAVPVSGVLTLDGQPVAGARVRFVPTVEGGRTAIGDAPTPASLRCPRSSLATASSPVSTTPTSPATWPPRRIR